jgi:hypothetical protein
MFYYEEGYAMDVGEAANKLIEARDAYFQAWIEWNDTCLGGCMSADDEADTVRACLNKMLDKLREENVD